MPELPEVQTVVNDLKEGIIGEKIVDFCTDFPKSLKSKSFEKMVVGEKIIAIERVAKNIIIKLSCGKNIVVHLKMTGKLIYQKERVDKKTALQEKHTHSVFFFKSGKRLEFNDVRKFGTLQLLSNQDLLEKFSKNGIDPFSKEFTRKNLLELFKKKSNKKIKAALMDQSSISGIGNIYASEILFDAKISPARKISSLLPDEINRIRKSTLKILTKSIRMRGTSVSDYRDSNNKKGMFQNYLKVYKRHGQKCKTCDTIVEKIIIEQRSAFFCSKCQR